MFFMKSQLARDLAYDPISNVNQYSYSHITAYIQANFYVGSSKWYVLSNDWPIDAGIIAYTSTEHLQ